MLKKKPILEKSIAIGLVLLMMAGGFMAIATTYDMAYINTGVVSGDSPQYTTITPLRINNDSDMDNAAAILGWPGSGSDSDPYIIEDYEIDAAGQTEGIYIGNVTRYFVVRNCYIHNAASGGGDPTYHPGAAITLYNMDGVADIRNLVCEESEYGIHLNRAYTTMMYNISMNDMHKGVYIHYSDNSELHEINITSSGFSVELNDTFYTVVENGTIRCDDWGVNVDDCGGCYVLGLDIAPLSDRLLEGIHLHRNDAISVHDNTIHGFNGSAIVSTYGMRDYIYNNRISESKYGVLLDNADTIKVRDNTMDNCTYGIYDYHSHDDELSGNRIYNTTYDGIYMENSQGESVTDNEILCNEYSDPYIFYGRAIYTKDSSYLNISHNSIHDNRQGIEMHSADGSVLYNNTISNNSHTYSSHQIVGIYESSGVRVIHNNMYESSESTVLHIESGNGSYVGNNRIHANYGGMEIDREKNCSISGNTVNASSSGLYVYSNFTGSRVWNNTMVCKEISIHGATDFRIENNAFKFMKSEDYIYPGLAIYKCENAIIRNNTMERYGITLDGTDYQEFSDLEYWNSHTIENNTVARKPVVYLKDANGPEIPENIGQLILANVTNAHISHLNIADVHQGLTAAYCRNLQINDSVFEHSYFGVMFFMTNRSKIWHNSFIDCDMPAEERMEESYVGPAMNNTWDNGYQSGGNYYTKGYFPDDKCGPGQNLTGSDGRSDYFKRIYTVNYPYGSDEKDRYPLLFRPDQYPALVEAYPESYIADPHPIVWARITTIDSYMTSYHTKMYIDGYNVLTDSSDICGIGLNVSYNHGENFTEGKVVCRVVSEDSDGKKLDATWNFTVDLSAPYVTDLSPAPSGYSGNNTTLIWIHISDNYSGVDAYSTRLYVNGYNVSYKVTEIPGGYNISYWHEAGFNDGDNVRCSIVVKDNVGWRLEYSWNFTVGSRISATYHSGWNTVSLPWLDEPTDIETALSGASWDRAMLYIDGSWYTYNKDRNDKYNAGFPKVDRTSGILVDFTAETTLSGNTYHAGNTTILLHKGWNLVGYVSSHDQRVSDAMADIPYQSVQLMNGSKDEQTLRSTDYLLVGMSYWIYVDEDCVWTIEW